MNRILKQVCGIDVAQDELVVAMGRMDDDLSTEIYANKTFANSAKGFDLLIAWTNKLSEEPVSFVMEATGVYHEKLAYHLAQHGKSLSIVLPNKISNYFRTLDVKTVTDKTASEAITLFGLGRTLASWTPPDPGFKQMRQLTRERDQLVQIRTMTKNQLHAEKAEAFPNPGTLKRLEKHILFISKQIIEVVAAINSLINSNEKLKSDIGILTSIKGVGILTAATVMGETNGFDLIRNKKQLASYAGLDVKEKQSGTSVKGKPRISKRGNKHLRKCMHLPALVAIKHDERCKSIFARLVAKHGVKMKAAVAIQRRLLQLMFTLYKKQEKYNPAYLKANEAEKKAVPEKS